MVLVCPNFSKDANLLYVVRRIYAPHQPRRRAIMALQFRRVVTGHDASGSAIVKIDEIAKNLV
jgi:hypothetical protein